ncbi:MAG: succinate dehydrogenase, cytochrome b556 subunit [Methylophilaceae bacterium]|nr:succinate dehydrogenase, cytochrome b556 subunit [Methylophilaceae bacterium]MDG1820849.1 succinate dehydrogenase, cytochrome b556 subunit [Methylophilaceae bacterium]MDG2294025.1 succinate dehydrogenase, cytochrome b556 subunit [Methylophilaceae bacterium]
MQKQSPNNRPKNLNLFTIKLPINALVSILHRASGVALFLLLPFMLSLLQQSLISATGYQAVSQMFNHAFVKLLLIACSWAFFHHFYAGIRHLLQDVHWMTTLQKSRFTGRVVLILVGLSVVLFAWSIF